MPSPGVIYITILEFGGAWGLIYFLRTKSFSMMPVYFFPNHSLSSMVFFIPGKGVTNKTFKLARCTFSFHVEMFFLLGELKASLVIKIRIGYEL